MDTRVVFLLSILLLLLCFLPTPLLARSTRCHKQDYTALMKFKAALNNPEILATPTTECCSWFWADCDRKTFRIDTLYINGANITGEIPSEVGDLPYLITIMIRNTNLTGKIPSTITKLKHLSMILISENKLSGPIPSFLSQLKSLLYLELSANQFTGSIPSSLAKPHKLGLLRLDHNKLTGTIPESLVNNFDNSRIYLDLSHNNLRGEIPKSFAKVGFGTIDLSGNKLEGDASVLFKANGTSDTITLSNNKFAFDLSKVNLPSNLVNFDISHNRIFGRIPDEITGLNLQNLNVSYNRLSGKIPQGGNVQKFDSYNFYRNKGLCGSPLGPCK